MKHSKRSYILGACLALVCACTSICSAHAPVTSSSNKANLVDEQGRINKEAYAMHMQEAATRGEWVPADIDLVIDANSYELELQAGMEDQPVLLSESGQKLKYAAVLAKADGVSTAKITSMDKASAEALLAANTKYPNDEITKDTYRHFYWNFMGAKKVGAENCRLFTTNYEWASIYLEETQNFFVERFNYWAKEVGGDNSEITALAQAEADVYMKNLRDATVKKITTYSKYTTTFSAATMQDFFNNYQGQGASASYTDVNTAFNNLKASLATGDNPSASQKLAGYNSMVWKP